MNKKFIIKIFLSFVLFTILFSIGFFYFVVEKPKREVVRIVHDNQSHKSKIIVIQPMGDIDMNLAKNTFNELKKIYPHFILKSKINLPAYAYYSIKNRYRADSILNRMKHQYGLDTVVISILHQDISVTKGRIQDWGVMGLGHRPGNACVVSTYRLQKTNLSVQFYKVCIHELGHTQGLPHCPDLTCYMRNAEGGNPLDEEVHFCEKCRKIMIEKGWKLK